MKKKILKRKKNLLNKSYIKKKLFKKDRERIINI